MAYYASLPYDPQIGEFQYNLALRNSDYELGPYQYLYSSPGFDSDEPNLFDYYSVPTHVTSSEFEFHVPNSNVTRSGTSWCYSAYNYTEPNLLLYEPVCYNVGYVCDPQTRYLISYSTANSDFNEPEFEEYDPTPYGGGYDPVSTYGEPLAPSDEICYPRSTSLPPKEDDSSSVNPPSLPIVGDNVDKGLVSVVSDGAREIDSVEKGGEETNGKNENTLNVEKGSGNFDGVEEQDDRGREEYNYFSGNEYDYPWPEYDYHRSAQGHEAPEYEHDSYDVDFCESIFGHCPCLIRKQRQEYQKESVGVGDGRNRNPWEAAADYIFGGQDEERNEDYENSWFRKLSAY